MEASFKPPDSSPFPDPPAASPSLIPTPGDMPSPPDMAPPADTPAFRALDDMPHVASPEPGRASAKASPRGFTATLSAWRQTHAAWFKSRSATSWQNLLKAVLAYEVAFCLVLIPPVISWVGPVGMLCPIGILIVNPARTMGSMIEATLVAALGVGIAWAYCLMAQASLVAWNTANPEQPGGWILFLFVLPFIIVSAGLKVLFPRTYVGGLLGALIVLFTLTSNVNMVTLDTTVVTRISLPIALSLVIVLVVNITVFPMSGVARFRKSLKSALLAFKTDLDNLTTIFLAVEGAPIPVSSTKALVTSLPMLKHDSSWELSFGALGPADHQNLIRRLKRVSLAVSGLRSAVRTKIFVMKERDSPDSSASASPSPKSSPPMDPLALSSTLSASNYASTNGDTVYSLGRTFTEAPTVRLSKKHAGSQDPVMDFGTLTRGQTRAWGSRAHMVELLTGFASPIQDLLVANTAALRALADEVWREQGSHWISLLQYLHLEPKVEQSVFPMDLDKRIEAALAEFDKEHWARIGIIQAQPPQPGVREELLLLFYFAFQLREFTKEVLAMSQIVIAAIKRAEASTSSFRRLWMPPMPVLRKLLTPNALTAGLRRFSVPTKGDSTPDLAPRESPGLPGPVEVRVVSSDQLHHPPLQAKAYPHSHRKPAVRAASRLLRGAAAFVRFCRSHEARYAIKVGLAIVILALPAWIPSTTTWYNQSKGQWALITLFIVMSPSVGGSTLMSLYRVAGTLIGALYAIIVYQISGSPWFFAFATIPFAIPFWFVYLSTKHVRLGTTALLTYPLIVLTFYDNNFTYPGIIHDSVILLATKRVLATLTGVFVAIIVTSYVWGFRAQRELRLSLGLTILHLGELYSRAVSLIMADHENKDTLAPQVAVVQHLQDFIQKALGRHVEMMALADIEPRLSSRFPREIYQQMNYSCTIILNQLLSLTSAADIGFGPSVMTNLILPVNQYRKDAFAAILLYFHILSSSLSAKTPLPPYFPNAQAARTLLLEKIQALPFVQQSSLMRHPEDYFQFLFYYAYSLGMKEVIHELEKLAALIKLVVGESESIRAIFTMHGGEAASLNPMPLSTFATNAHTQF